MARFVRYDVMYDTDVDDRKHASLHDWRVIDETSTKYFVCDDRGERRWIDKEDPAIVEAILRDR
ncbi:hypothetical protein C4552_03065 [Candidatus Parcubacteria bacterium]|nr:MAG: hypothetical protein C4552_03065 [Candidatus Parcubacteria bacterium]